MPTTSATWNLIASPTAHRSSTVPSLIDTDILQGALPTGGTGNSANQFCPDNSQSLACFRTTQQGYPANIASAAAFNPQNAEAYYSPAHLPTGYIQSYNLGFQYQVDKGTIVDIAYVGAHGVHIINLTDLNQGATQLPGATLSLAARRPIPNFSDISTASSAGFLQYNSLQTKIQRKQGKIFLLNSFTYSQARDQASSDGEASHGDSVYFDRDNPVYDQGVSGYNQPFNNTTAVRYDLPRVRAHNAIVKGALDGWRLTNITTVSSGFPLNLSYSLGTVSKLTNLGLRHAA